MAQASQLSHTERVMSVAANHPLRNSEHPHEIISDSWRRCMNEYGLDPCKIPDTEIIEASLLSDHREQMHDLITVARGECENLYNQISQSGYIIILTDGQGVILDQICDPGLEKTFNESGLMPGSVWSEKKARIRAIPPTTPGYMAPGCENSK